jgi:hypothetical protein
MTQALDEYAEGRLQQLLAEDPRIAEQGITVSRREDTLVLCGSVESPARRAQIEDAVHAEFPDARIVCDIGVVRAAEPTEPEDLP